MDGHAASQKFEIVIKKGKCPHEGVHFKAAQGTESVGYLLDEALGELQEDKDLIFGHERLLVLVQPVTVLTLAVGAMLHNVALEQVHYLLFEALSVVLLLIGWQLEVARPDLLSLQPERLN